jgi:hypothetical protein
MNRRSIVALLGAVAVAAVTWLGARALWKAVLVMHGVPAN